MKKLFIVITMMVFVCGNIMAQNERGGRKHYSPEEMIKVQTERMAEMLSLTDEQKTALFELNKKYAGKIDGMRRGGGQENRTQQARPTKEEMEKMRTEREDAQLAYKAELKTILSDEQFTKYEKAMKQVRQRGGGQRGGQWGGQRGGQFHRNRGGDNGGNFGNDNQPADFGNDNSNEGF